MSIFTPEIKHLKTFQERGKFLMAWRLSLTFFLLFFALSISFLFYSVETALTYLPISLICLGSLFYLKTTSNPKPIFWLIAISGTIVSHVTLYILPATLPYSNFLWIIAGVVFVFVAIGKIEGWWYIIFNSIGIGIYIFYGLDDHLGIITEFSFSAKANTAIEMTAAIIIVAYLMNQYQLYQTYARLQLNKLNIHLEAQNEEIAARNKENMTLVKEIHHRVKNNLQIIVSLLRMQRSEIKSEEARQHFNDVIGRVMTMSMIHQRLYQEKEASRIEIEAYLIELCNEILSLSETSQQRELDIKSTLKYVELKTIIPLGLIVNELVSNSVKHSDRTSAFNISVEIKLDGENLLLNYQDNGVWIEKAEAITGFGIELIEILTEQLNGSFKREGTRYEFTFVPDSD